MKNLQVYRNNRISRIYTAWVDSMNIVRVSFHKRKYMALGELSILKLDQIWIEFIRSIFIQLFSKSCISDYHIWYELYDVLC